MSYLANNDAFQGTGELNAKGQTLEVFLESYDPKKYECPFNTVDIAVLAESKEPAAKGALTKGTSKQKLLLIRRKNHPSIGMWALPGGFVDLKENLEDAAARELQEETGVVDIPLVQIGTFGAYDRDPRWRVITTLYGTILPNVPHTEAGDDAADARWFDVHLETADLSEKEQSVRLKLTHESGIRLSARAICTKQAVGGFQTLAFSDFESEGIASDHGLLILDFITKINR